MGSITLLDIPVGLHRSHGTRSRLYRRGLVGSLVQVGLLPAANKAKPDTGGVGYDDDDREREDYREYPVYRRVRDYLRGLAGGLGPGVDLASVVRVYSGASLGEEADLGIGREDLIPARRERHDSIPRQGHERHPDVLQLTQLYQDRARDCQGN